MASVVRMNRSKCSKSFSVQSNAKLQNCDHLPKTFTSIRLRHSLLKNFHSYESCLYVRISEKLFLNFCRKWKIIFYKIMRWHFDNMPPSTLLSWIRSCHIILNPLKSTVLNNNRQCPESRHCIYIYVATKFMTTIIFLIKFFWSALHSDSVNHNNRNIIS